MVRICSTWCRCSSSSTRRRRRRLKFRKLKFRNVDRWNIDDSWNILSAFDETKLPVSELTVGAVDEYLLKICNVYVVCSMLRAELSWFLWRDLKARKMEINWGLVLDMPVKEKIDVGLCLKALHINVIGSSSLYTERWIINRLSSCSRYVHRWLQMCCCRRLSWLPALSHQRAVVPCPFAAGIDGMSLTFVTYQ